MDILINQSLRAYIDPLTADEHEALERSLLREGCRDALVLWGNVLVDGHNRYGICKQHDLPFRTVQMDSFQSMDDVHLWMIEQHLGRRSVSDFQRGVLALRKREIIAAREAAAAAQPAADSPAAEDSAEAESGSGLGAVSAQQREAIAREAKISRRQMGLIEKIHRQAAPEVIAAVRAGGLSLDAAAAVASLPATEQKQVADGGREQLRDAARRVRESRRRPAKEAAADAGHPETGAVDPGAALVASLRVQIADLGADNQRLRAEVAELRRRLGESVADTSTPPWE